MFSVHHQSEEYQVEVFWDLNKKINKENSLFPRKRFSRGHYYFELHWLTRVSDIWQWALYYKQQWWHRQWDCHKVFTTCNDSKGGTWKKIMQSQHFLKTKDSQLFCKHTNNIIKFEGCFLRGHISLNSFKVSSSSRVA